ncbi:MAG: hypothetical protein IJG00_01885 [Clostridia bacterium]|nr:hypothetical protein [Clostridia bacterium]
MYKKKNILIIVFFASLISLGMLLNACAEETPSESSQINTEETQIPQAPKKPKKDSTPKKEKPKKNNQNDPKTSQQKNESTKSAEPQEKNETNTDQENQKQEEKNLDLPNVKNSEVQLKPYFSQISQNTEGKSILKTLISWALILAGIILILKVIFSNRKIPKSYTFNKKSKHTIIPHKGKPNKYNL